MSKWTEYLKANGATDEELKVLDNPVAARAFDKQQADLEAAQAEFTKLDQTMKNYETRVQSWYTENDNKLKQVQNKVIAAESEAARAKAALLEANRLGLVDVAKDLGYTVDPPKPPVTPGEPDARYLTMDKFTSAVDQVGANLAALEDMVIEHKLLFPDIPLRVSDLRREAMSQNKTVTQFWEEKYKVPSAREQAAQKQRDAEIAKWKAEGAKEKETELVSKFGNPETRALVPSRSPFTIRKEDPLRADNQPWNKSESQLANDRVSRAAQRLVERQAGGEFKN
jgi:hypothetical protein